MTETLDDQTPPADDPVTPVHVPEPRRARFDLVPWLLLLGVVVLGAALFWLYQHPHLPAGGAARPSADARVPALQHEMTALTQRVETLEQHAAAAPPRASPGASPGGTPATPPAEGTSPVLARLRDRIAAVESRLPATLPANQASQDALNALANRVGRIESSLSDKVAALDQQVAAARAASAEVQRIAERAARLGRLQQAAAALDMGRPLGHPLGHPLGSLANTPPALQRYADTAPPTEAGLRLRYPAAARAAREASRPERRNQPFWRRVWSRAQSAVTVRQGDRVVIGDPAAGVLAQAGAQLNAGDLTGAMTTLDQLPAAPKAAMASWLTDARNLLDARAALADAEDHS